MDKIEKFGKGSIIQHGKLNDRIYLLKTVQSDIPDIVYYINRLAAEQNYSKIFCKIPAWSAPLFFAEGYIIEAIIPKFYINKTDGFFVSRFLNPDRLLALETDRLSELSNCLKNKTEYHEFVQLPKYFKTKTLDENWATPITEVYKQVFKTYPFPVSDESYIRKTMKEDVQYFGIEHNNKLVALSSAEVDNEYQYAEMTDFAVLPEFRGKKLSVFLLKQMENEMRIQGIKTLFTISRVNSIPMNKTFINQKYNYAGTLIKNTQIAGKIESMNVLYKKI